MPPVLIRIDSNVPDPARALLLRGLIRRFKMANDIFSEVDPPNEHQRPRQQQSGVFAIPYDVIQVWSIPTSRLEISDRLLRQPVSSLTRFPARTEGTRVLDVGLSLEHPQNPSGSIQLTGNLNLLPSDQPVNGSDTSNDPGASNFQSSDLNPISPIIDSSIPNALSGNQGEIPDTFASANTQNNIEGSSVVSPTADSVGSPGTPSALLSRPHRRSSVLIDLTEDNSVAPGGEEIPFEVIVESMGLRRGEPHLQFPLDVDGLDSPENVVSSLRLGPHGQRWFPNRDDRCGLCLEAHSVENPLFYTPCGHIFHQTPCWSDLRQTAVSHPHRRRFDGRFVHDENGRAVLDYGLTKCPSCRTYVEDDTLGQHSNTLVVPYNPAVEFRDGYEFCVGRSREIEIFFVNREVIEQPRVTSERTGGHSNHCGPLALFNTNQELSNSQTRGPQVSANLDRALTRWSRQIQQGTLPNSSNLNPEEIHSYISRGGLTSLASADVHVWCPTVSSGANIANSLNSFVEGERPLALLSNNGNHWFVFLLRRMNDHRINIVFMEPWKAAIPQSLSLLQTQLLPQLKRAIEETLPPPLRVPSPLPRSNIEQARQLQMEQDAEYARSLELDQQREARLENDSSQTSRQPEISISSGPRSTEENSSFAGPTSASTGAGLASQSTPLTGVSNPSARPGEDDLSGRDENLRSTENIEISGRSRRDAFWHNLYSDDPERETPATPPPRNRGNRRYDSDSS